MKHITENEQLSLHWHIKKIFFLKTILQTKCQYIRDHIIEVTIIMIRNYDKLTKPKLLFKADSYKQQTQQVHNQMD